MNIKEKLKLSFMRKQLDKRKRKNPFDPHYVEHYKLPEEADKYAINSYFLSCHNMSGESLMLRHAVRGEGITEVWFAYRDTQGNEYICDKQYYANEAPTAKVECLETEKKWRFWYNGKVINQKSKKVHQAKFEADFDATGQIFEFTAHLSSKALAGAIAKEKWTKEYFSDLKQQNQVHCEQSGKLTGSLVLDGKEISLELNAMRDHSFGRRDWNFMNNHFWLTCLFEDGTMFNANVASFASIQSVATGFIEDGKEVNGVSAAKVDIEIENYKVPEKFSYSGEFANGEKFSLDCELQSVFLFTLDGGNYLIYEGVGTFDMNGKKGRGNLEFGFNGDESRIRKLR